MRLLVTGGLQLANGLIDLGGEIAWPRPTPAGDVLHIEGEILEIKPSRSKPKQGTVTVRSPMLNQNGETVYVLNSETPGLEAPEVMDMGTSAKAHETRADGERISKVLSNAGFRRDWTAE